MELLHLADHIAHRPSQPSWYVTLAVSTRRTFRGTLRPLLKLELSYFLLPQSVIFEGLYGVFRIYLGGEDIVQSKLAWKHVHQDVYRMFRLLEVWKSIENIYTEHEPKPGFMEIARLRM